MSKKWYKIEDIYPASGDLRFALSAESPLDQVTYNVFSSDDFTDAAVYEYGERSICIPETPTPLVTLYARFARWKAQRGPDIAAAYGALRSEYKPLENYSMVENHTGNDTGLKTPTNWKETTTHSVSNDYKVVDSEKPTNWKESKEFSASNDYKETDTQKPNQWKVTNETIGTENDNASATTNQIIPFNGSDFANVNKSKSVDTHRVQESTSGEFATEHTLEGTRKEELSTTGQYDREHTQTGSSTDEKATTGTFEDKMTYNSTLTRKGNIGVTTSQQMLLSELDARTRQFVREVIREFFDLVSAYVN